MAVLQKLTLTQLEKQTKDFQVNILWTSEQNNGSHNYVTRTAYLYYSVNGGEKMTLSVQYTLPGQTENVILNTTISVPAREDGTAKVQVWSWMNTHISAGVVELYEELTLKPDASTISVQDALIGSATTVQIFSRSAEHTHTVQYTFGNQSGYLTETGDVTENEIRISVNEIPFKIPISFYEEIPNAKIGACQLFCTTYNGDTQIGDPQKASFMIAADENQCAPAVNGSIIDVNAKTVAVTGNANQLIRYHSKAQCTIVPELKYGADVSQRYINGTELQSDGDAIIIDCVDQSDVAFALTDSRGLRAEKTVEFNLIPYLHLTMSADIERDGPTSEKASLRCSGFFYRGDFGEGTASNELTFRYKIGSGELITVTIPYNVGVNGLNSYYIEIPLTDLNYRETYAITVCVSDKLETVEKKLILKKGIPVFDWGENDFNFNVPVNIEGEDGYSGTLLNVKGLLNADQLTIGYKPLSYFFYPVGSVFITYNLETDPNILFGGSWEQEFTGLTNDGIRWVRKS